MGLALASGSMAVAAAVEAKRREAAEMPVASARSCRHAYSWGNARVFLLGSTRWHEKYV